MAGDRANVNGIGGFFFRSKDPEALSEWYETHFAISRVGADAENPLWLQGAGPTVFSPFPADTDYFGETQPYMLNLRVSDLDALLDGLGAAGVKIDDNREDTEFGRFAWVYDPEGTKIELWEPPAQPPSSG